MTNPESLVEERQLLVGGKWVDASGGTYEIVNPATEEIVGHAPNATPADAAAAAAAARDALPGWAATMALPPDAKLRALRDPNERRRLGESAKQPGPMTMFSNWGAFILRDTFTEANKPYEGRTVADVAAELGKDPFDALLDIACADELATSVSFGPGDGTAVTTGQLAPNATRHCRGHLDAARGALQSGTS